MSFTLDGVREWFHADQAFLEAPNPFARGLSSKSATISDDGEDDSDSASCCSPPTSRRGSPTHSRRGSPTNSRSFTKRQRLQEHRTTVAGLLTKVQEHSK